MVQVDFVTTYDNPHNILSVSLLLHLNCWFDFFQIGDKSTILNEHMNLN